MAVQNEPPVTSAERRVGEAAHALGCSRASVAPERAGASSTARESATGSTRRPLSPRSGRRRSSSPSSRLCMAS